MSNFKDSESKLHNDKNINCHKSSSTFGAKAYFNRRSSSMSSPSLKQQSIVMKSNDVMKKYISLSTAYRDQNNDSHREGVRISNHNDRLQKSLVNSTINNSGNASGRSSSFVTEIAKHKFDALNKFNDSWNETESVLPCKEINNNSISGKFQVSGNGERKNIKLDNTFDLSDLEISGRSLLKFKPRDKENIDISIVPDPSSEGSGTMDVLRSAPNLNQSSLSSNAPFLGFNDSIVFGKGQDRESFLLDENSSASSTDLAPNRPSFIQVYSNALLNNSYLVSDDSIIESSQPLNNGNALGRKSVESCTKDYGNGQFDEKSISVKSYSPTTTHSDEECFQTNKNKTRTKFYVQQRENVILNSKRTGVNPPSSILEVGDNSGKSFDNMRESVASKLPPKQYSLVENSITDSLNKEPISSILPSSECLDKPAKKISSCRDYIKETHPKSCGKFFDNTHVLGVSMSNQSGWFNDNVLKDSIQKSVSTEKEGTIHKEHALLKHVDSYLEPNKIPLKKIVKIKQGKKDEINADQFGKHVECEKAANFLESGYKTLHDITEKQSTSPVLISGSLLKPSENFQTYCKDTNITNCDKNSVPSKKMSEVPPFSRAKFVVPGNSILSSSDTSCTKCLMKPVVQITSYNETKSVSGLTCGNSQSAFRPISRGLPGYSGTSRATSSLRGTDTSSMVELDQINNYSKGNSRLNPDDSAQRITSSKDEQKRSQTPYINSSFITADARIVSEPSTSKLSSSKTPDKSHFALVERSESDHNLSPQKCLADKLETKTSNLDLSKLSVPASTESSLSSFFLSPMNGGSQKMNFTRIVNTDANNVTLEDKTNLKNQSNSSSFTLPKPSKTYSRNPRIKLGHQWFETCTSKKMNNTGSKSRPIKKKELFNLRSSYKESSPVSGDSEEINSVVPLAGTVKQGKSVKETSPALYDLTEPDKDEDKQISNFDCFKRNRTVGNFNKIANKNIFCGFNVFRLASDGSEEEFSLSAKNEKTVDKTKNEATAMINLRRSARNRRWINYKEGSESDTDKSRVSLRNSQDPTSICMSDKTKIKNSILKNPTITNDNFPSSSCRSFDVAKRKTNFVNLKTQEENLSRKNSKSMQFTKVNNYKTDATNPNNVFDFTEEDIQLPIVKNDNQLNSKLCNNYASKFDDLRLNAKRGKTQTEHNTFTKNQSKSSYSVEIPASKKQVPVSEKRNCKNPAQKINNRKTHQQPDTLMNQKNPSDLTAGDRHCSVIEKRSVGKSCENPKKKSVNSLPQVKGQKEQTVVDSDNNFQNAYDLSVGHKNESAVPASEKRKSSTEPARNFKKVNMGREHLKAIFSSPKVLKERVLNSPSNSKIITVEFSALIQGDKASNNETNIESSNSLAQVSHINEDKVVDCGADTNIIIDRHIEMNPISVANDQVGKQCKLNDNAKSEQPILTEAALPESQIIQLNEKSKRLLSSMKTSINSLSNDMNELHKLLDITDRNH